MKDADLAFRLEPFSDVQNLATAWRDLEARADNPFFLGWRWIGAWLAGIERAPLLLSGTSGGNVVLLGLLAIGRRRELGFLGIPGARLHETGDPAEDAITIEHNGFLVARAWRDRAEAAAIGFLLSGRHGVRIDELHIRGAPDSFEAFAAGQGLLSIPARSPSWRVDLRAVREAGGGYLEQLSPNTRQQIRRSMRLYEKRGALSFDRARDPDEASRWFAALKDLHQRYWERRGEAGAFAHPFFEAFHARLIAEGTGDGGVELAKVSAGGEAIGYLYNFLYRGTVLSYQSGFAYEADPKLKPGLVSHSLCVEAHAASGGAVYDFMAGEAQHKASLGQRGPAMLYLLLQNPTATIKGANLLRRAAKAVLRR